MIVVAISADDSRRILQSIVQVLVALLVQVAGAVHEH